MYRLVSSGRFTKALRKFKKSGRYTAPIDADLEMVFDLLTKRKSLPASFLDHQLTGEFQMYRECHVRSDLLLVYYVDDQQEAIVLRDIGSHSQLFG